MLLSAGLGMLLALGIIFLWEFLDDTVKSVDDLDQFAGLNILGTVGRIKGKRYSEKILTRLESSSPTRESFRMIRNKIRFGSGDEPIKSIVITSPESEEGKSITAANLGVIMAQANVHTVLIDADLKNPVLHKVFNTSNRVGLVNLLESPEMAIQDCLKPTLINNLQLMTSGEAIQDQSDQLLAERIAEIFDYLKEEVDLVIIDGPPALLAADASILSNQAEGAILVVRAGKTKRRAIKQTLSDLEEANANLIGCIYNQVHKDIPITPYKRSRQEKNLFRQLKGLFNHGTDSMK
jgi:capsular exopolysaccharide synthesis family protein